MTNGFDGLVVNHGQLDQATQDLTSAVKASTTA